MALQSLGGVGSAQNSILQGLNQSNRLLGLIGQQISSQNRIVRPSIDPSGFIASQRLLSQLSGQQAAQQSIQYSRGFVSVADGGLQGIQQDLDDLRVLSLQAANSFGDDSLQASLQSAIDTTVSRIDSQLSQTRFGATQVFNDGIFRTSQDTSGVLDDVQISQTPRPVGEGITVDVEVQSVGAQATTTLTGVSGATEFTLRGSDGQRSINFTGTTSAELTTQINQFTDQTGIEATDLGGGSVRLDSLNAGSRQVVDVSNVTGTGFTGGTGTFNGTDAQVTVNGANTSADGNIVSFNTNNLRGSFVVDASTPANTTTSFDIERGGFTVVTSERGDTITAGFPLTDGSGLALGSSSGRGSLASLLSGGPAAAASGNFGDTLAILDAAGSEVLTARTQLGSLDNTLARASSTLETQSAAAANAQADIAGVNLAEAFASLQQAGAQNELQILLLRETNNNAGTLTRLLG